MTVSLSLVLSESQVNVASNASVVTANVYITSDGSSYNRTSPPGSITIDGTTTPFQASFSTGGRQWLASASKTVTHNGDGTKSIAASASYDTGGYYGTIKASASKTLTRIPRKAIAISNSAWSATLGKSSVTVTVEKKTSAFTYKKYVEVNGKTWTYDNFSSSAGREAWTFAFPLDLAKLSPSSGTFIARMGVITYSGSEEIGRDYYSITCTVPDNIRASLSEHGASYVSPFQGMLLQGHSKLRLYWTFGESNLYGATIDHLVLKVGGAKYDYFRANGAFRFPPGSKSGSKDITLPRSGQIPWEIAVYDTRGRGTVYSGKETVQSYSPPTIESFTLSRAKSTGEVDASGVIGRADYRVKKSNVGGKNTLSIEVYDGKARKYSSTLSGSTSSSDSYALISGLATSKSYTLTLRITDSVGSSASATATVARGLVLMDFCQGGVGIGTSAQAGYVSFDEEVMPVKGLAETGESGNFSWIKFGNGTLIQWYRGQPSIGISQVYGPGYLGSVYFKFPVLFKDVPSVSCSEARWGTGASWPIVFEVTIEKVALKIFDFYKRDTGATDISFIAVGKWK